MKTKQSLLVFTNLFPNPKAKNKGIFIKQLTDSLVDYYDVTVVSPVAMNPISLLLSLISKSTYLGRKVEKDNYSVFYPRYLIIPKIFRSLHWLSIFISTYSLVKSLNNSKKIDVISAHWIYPDASAAVLIGKMLKIKVSVHALGCDINDYINYYIRKKIIRKTLENADLIVTKSQALKDVIQNEFKNVKNIKVILNGIDKELFKPMPKQQARNELGIGSSQKNLIFVGNFQIEKGLDYLLDAMSLVLKNINDVHLYVVGDGPLKSSVIRKINALKLADNVHLMGAVSHDKLPVYFSAADFLCLPSLREGCPNVVLEALSCGTRIIASDVGAVPDILTSESLGFIHPPQDINAMALTICKALNSENISFDFDWYTWKENTQLIHQAFNEI